MATALRTLPEEALAPEAVPFHLSEAWARCWDDAYGEGRPLLLEAGEARLRMSLVKGRLGPLRFPLLASPTNLQTCYFDLEGGDARAEALDALADRMLETGAAQVRIDWLINGARLLDAAKAWGRRHSVLVEPFAISPLASCSGDFESYLARTGSSVRKYWKACRRHVLNGPIDFEIVTGGPGLATLVDEMFALEAAGWKGREGSAILSSPADERFYRSLAFAAAEAGALRIATLREEGRLLAYEYCVMGGDTILAMKVGYDESRSRLQPGHMIALLNIRDACADPAIAWYDMLGNSMRIAEYKRRFATDYRTISRIRMFPRTAIGRLFHALYRSKPVMKALRGRVRGLARRLRR